MSKTLNDFHGEWTGESGLNLQMGYFFFTVIAGVLVYGALKDVIGLAGILGYAPVGGFAGAPSGSDYYSHILLIPFVSAYFLFLDRRRILRRPGILFRGLLWRPADCFFMASPCG